ncbi:MAG: T9SS type A sorting domain-containing protein [Flavobacteriia bacterium]|nr:T9SS type A sorting domain-containing protein [Flavobacteriia bacterium]
MKKAKQKPNHILFILIFILNFCIFGQTTTNVLTSFSSNSDYNAYMNFAVNNTHFIDNNEQGNIFVVFVDSIKQLTIMTRDNGNWYTQVVATASPSIIFKNPNVYWKQGKLHVSWFELASGNTIIKYAKGTPSSTGLYNWNINTFANIPLNAPKYLALSLPDSTYSPIIGFTEAGDTKARMFVSTGESNISPLTSENPDWERSSDISIASDSNVVVVVWEEHWNVPSPDSRLLFTMSNDGGNSWLPIQNLFNTEQTSIVGDPSIVIADTMIYVAFHGNIGPSVSHIRVARKFPSMSQFELLNFGTTDSGVVGKGWLPNIDACDKNPNKLVVSWERTDSAYFDKWQHRVAVAYISDATLPNSTLNLGPETSSLSTDTSRYDLNSNIIISPDGQIASWVWINIHELTSDSDIVMTLYFQEVTLNCLLTSEEETYNKNSKIRIYPNPTSDELRFSSPQSCISIFNTQGVLMSEYQNETMLVSVKNLPLGLYFVKTNTGFGKFIKIE